MDVVEAPRAQERHPRTRSWGPAFFWLACCLFAVSAWRVLGADLDWQLRIVPDDTFYYLQIARNLAATGRSAFDDVSVTNGYHPLWMAVLTAAAALVHDKRALMTAALAISLGLHVAAAILLRRALGPLVPRDWAWTAAACWIINPLPFVLAIQSTEATMHGACAVLVFMLHVRLADRARDRLASYSLVLVYGAALGLLCLARTSGLLVAALALTWMGVAARSRGYGAPQIAARVLAAGSAVALMLAPWWLFSLAQVGTIAQDSGAMKMLWASDLYPSLAERLGNLGVTLTYFGRRTVSQMTAWNFSHATWIVAWACLSVPPLVVLASRRASLHASAIRAAVVPVFATVLVYGTLFVERQLWWLMLPCLAIFLASFIALPLVLESARVGTTPQRVVQAALLVLTIAVFVRWHVKDRMPYPWQPDVRRSQLDIEARLPPAALIGCFNAGIPQYFGAGRVVALDGLVNHDVLRYWKERRVDAYLRDHGIGFIADEERTLQRVRRFTEMSLELEERASYPLRGWPTGRRLLWEVMRPPRERAR